MNHALILLVLLAAAARAGIVSDAAFGYSIDLPSGWVQVKTRENQHHFKDASGSSSSRISIVKYPIEKADYPTPGSWTEAQFIAYKLAVETSAFPYGTVAYYDSSSARTLGGEWAPEAFSIMFPGDGQQTYCEFIRYCSRGDFGYEIYALGDSVDMMEKVDFYAGIIGSLTLSNPMAGIRIRVGKGAITPLSSASDILVDPIGRQSGKSSSSGTSSRSPIIRFRHPAPAP